MKKKTVEAFIYPEGVFDFYIDDLEKIAEILKDAYGSYDIETTEHELEDVTELSKVPDDSLKSVKLSAPAKPKSNNIRNTDKLKKYTEQYDYLGTTGLRLSISSEHGERISLYLRNRDEFKAIGTAEKIKEVIERAKTGSVDEAGLWGCKVTIRSNRRSPQKASHTAETTPVSVMNPITVEKINSSVDINSISKPVDIAPDRRSYFRRNKDHLIHILIAAVVGAGLTLLIKLIFGS